MPNNDIVLVEVRKRFKFDETRKPIKLFEYINKVEENATAVNTGWGRLNLWGDGPEIL